VTARRGALLGLALLGAYLAVAAATFALHLLPGTPILDDNIGPPKAYDWVNPPKALALSNLVPGPANGSVPLGASGSVGEAQTPDSQCQVLFEPSSVPPAAGQTSVRVTMVPLDPASLGPPPPGLAYDSNAYRIGAAYEPSGAPVSQLSFTLVLNFVAAGTGGGTRMEQRSATGWRVLASTPASTFQLFAPATSAGIFVIAGPAGQSAAAPPNRVVQGAEIAAPFLVVIALVVLALTRLRRSAH